MEQTIRKNPDAICISSLSDLFLYTLVSHVTIFKFIFILIFVHIPVFKTVVSYQLY